jgi:hypothetical protein
MKPFINPDRPVEELTGDNRGIVRMRLGNIHAMSSYLDAARAARPKSLRKFPVALRRGWAKCVIDTHRSNQALYTAVMHGDLVQLQ